MMEALIGAALLAAFWVWIMIYSRPTCFGHYKRFKSVGCANCRERRECWRESK